MGGRAEVLKADKGRERESRREWNFLDMMIEGVYSRQKDG